MTDHKRAIAAMVSLTAASASYSWVAPTSSFSMLDRALFFIPMWFLVQSFIVLIVLGNKDR